MLAMGAMDTEAEVVVAMIMKKKHECQKMRFGILFWNIFYIHTVLLINSFY